MYQTAGLPCPELVDLLVLCKPGRSAGHGCAAAVGTSKHQSMGDGLAVPSWWVGRTVTVLFFELQPACASVHESAGLCFM